MNSQSAEPYGGSPCDGQKRGLLNDVLTQSSQDSPAIPDFFGKEPDKAPTAAGSFSMSILALRSKPFKYVQDHEAKAFAGKAQQSASGVLASKQRYHEKEILGNRNDCTM
jgi:hypothetical protein